jgi:hypothetical protein
MSSLRAADESKGMMLIALVTMCFTPNDEVQGLVSVLPCRNVEAA